VFTAFVNGTFLPSSEKPFFTAQNPLNSGNLISILNLFVYLLTLTSCEKGVHLAKFIGCDKQTFDLAVDACSNSLNSWRQLSLTERGKILYK